MMQRKRRKLTPLQSLLAAMIGIAGLNGFSSTALAQDKPTVLVELDGSGSADPDGDPLQYEWKQVGGPEVVLSDTSAPKPFFRTSQAGLYRFQLVVSDGRAKSVPAVIEVLVERSNLAPLAKVPESLEAEPGDKVLIDGTRSFDQDGDRLNYAWRQVSGPPLYLQPESLRTAKLAFVPKQEGDYAFELIVSDKRSKSEPVICRLKVVDKNLPPVARIVAPHTVTLQRVLATTPQDMPESAPIAVIQTQDFADLGSTVSLDGRGSLAQGDASLKYYWKQVDGPFVRSFNSDVEGILSFQPEEVGTYSFRLVVNDGKLDSRSAETTIKVVEQNAAPVAVADAPSKAVVGRHICLDGSRSFDRESQSLEYFWRQVSGPNVKKYSLGKEGSACPSFVPYEAGTYSFELTVYDGKRRSKPTPVSIIVDRGNTAPTVNLSAAATVKTGIPTVLDAQGADNDGDALSYVWRQVSGPEILEQPTRQKSLTLTPIQSGVYEFECIASDGNEDSQPKRIRIVAEDSAVQPAAQQAEPEDTSAMQPPAVTNATSQLPMTSVNLLQSQPQQKSTVSKNPAAQQQQMDFLNSLLR